MKILSKPLIIFLTSFLLLACSRNEITQKNIIQVNPHQAIPSIPLSEIADSLSYIILETSGQSLMTRITEIIIKKDYIYAVDAGQQAVFVFDKNGKFECKLAKKGDGPDEYLRLEKVRIDEEEKYIEVLDYRGPKSRLIRYKNLSFDKISETSFPNPPISNSWIKGNDNYYYFSPQQIENQIKHQQTNADLIVVKDYEIKEAIFDKKITTGGNYYILYSETFSSNKRGDLFASLMFHNTFYKLENGKAFPILKIDFGKYGIDTTIGLKSTKEQMDYLFNQVKNKAFFPVLNINSSQIQAFSYYFKDQKKQQLYHYLHFKISGKKYHVKNIINDLGDYPKQVFLSSSYFAINHEVFQDDHLIDIVLPTHENKGEKIVIPGFGTIEPEDNPVIILMKLKNNLLN